MVEAEVLALARAAAAQAEKLVWVRAVEVTD